MIKGLLSKSGNNNLSNSNSNNEQLNNNKNSDDLPSGWKSVTSRSTGKTYYQNVSTGATQWKKPTIEEAPKTKNVADVISSKAAKFGMGFSSGLTNIFNQANTRLQTTLNSNSSKQILNANIFSPLEKERNANNEIASEYFEYNRLTGALGINDPKKFSNRNAEAGLICDELPKNEVAPQGYEWTSKWMIDKTYTDCDSNGWCFGQDFSHILQLYVDNNSHGERHPTDVTCRRRWLRFRKLIVVEDTTPMGESMLEAPASRNSEESNVERLESSGRISTSSSGRISTGSKENADRKNDEVHVEKKEGIFQKFTNSSNITEKGKRENDPFAKTKANQGGIFQKFTAPRSGKDYTKDYQTLKSDALLWLIDTSINEETKSAETIRKEAMNLEKSIKEANEKAAVTEEEMNSTHKKTISRVNQYQGRLTDMANTYVKMRDSHKKLLSSNKDICQSLKKLRQEVNDMDLKVNEELRTTNDEMEAENQALSEKEKALSTARMRYRQDNDILSKSLDDATRQSEKTPTKDLSTDLRNEIKDYVLKISKSKSQLDNLKSQKQNLFNEKQDLINQAVKNKSNAKLSSTNKISTAIDDIENEMKNLKDEQKSLIRSYAENSDQTTLHKIDKRRDEIRARLAALREERFQLNQRK